MNKTATGSLNNNVKILDLKEFLRSTKTTTIKVVPTISNNSNSNNVSNTINTKGTHNSNHIKQALVKNKYLTTKNRLETSNHIQSSSSSSSSQAMTTNANNINHNKIINVREPNISNNITTKDNNNEMVYSENQNPNQAHLVTRPFLSKIQGSIRFGNKDINFDKENNSYQNNLYNKLNQPNNNANLITTNHDTTTTTYINQNTDIENSEILRKKRERDIYLKIRQEKLAKLK